MLTSKVSEIGQKLQDGKLSAFQLCKICLDRAKHINSLNAFVTLLEDRALLEAKVVDDQVPKTSRHPMQGIPIAVKDNFCLNGVPTTCASKMLSNFVPSYNATVVERLKQAGSIFIGKTNLDEFAMGSGTVDSIHGPTKNIWGSEIAYSLKYKDGKPVSGSPKQKLGIRIAGGSSGGSAVAVATGACFAAIGSDTGGSTRNPASYCGVIGLKPTYGTVSRYGLIPLVNSMDVPGIITRTVEDTVCVYNTIAGYDEKDSTTIERNIPQINLENNFDISAVRVGIPKEYHCSGLSDSVLMAWSKVADILEDAGAKVSQVSMPYTAYSIACYSILNQCEVASNMARYDGLEFGYRAQQQNSTEQLFADSRSYALSEVVRGRILAGNYFLLNEHYDKYFLQALKVRRLIANDFEKVWSDVDILLTPATLSEPPLMNKFLHLDNRKQCVTQDYCTQPANMAGCPAVSFPVDISPNHLPISLQLIAPNFSEQVLLNVCYWLEQVLQFPSLHIE